MNNQFGTLKSKVLACLVEAYSNDDKQQVKNIISLLKENKDYRELYVFYEELEGKYFDNETDAQQYVEEIIPLLEDKYNKSLKFLPTLNESLSDVEYTTTPLYEELDILLAKKRISNVDRKISARTNLIKHLTTPKNDGIVNEDTKVVTNEPLLFAALTNVFNSSFENQLDEEQKTRLKTIMSMSTNEIEENINELQETILDKVSSLLTENSDPNLTSKLELVKEEVENISPTRFSLVKLETLKDGLE